MQRRLIPVLAMALVAAAFGLGTGPALAGGGGHGFCGEGFTDLATDQVRTHGSCFTPTVARIEPGDTVTFTNDDMTIHAVGGAAGSFGQMDQKLHIGKSISVRFDDEGTYPYVCVFHPGMAGAVVVGDGESDMAAAGRGVVIPPAKAATSAGGSGEAEDSPRNAAWTVPVGVALALGLLAIAAIPVRRRGKAPLIVTKM